MYKITWDPETGGVRLHSRIVDGTLGISPRPVFFEELNLLNIKGLGFSYPNAQEPILWAINKQYFYRGQHLFDVKGANIYDKPSVILDPEVTPSSLTPVDVATMLEHCKDYMFLLESEAIEFINDTFTQYAGARKTSEQAPVNRLDYEALAARAAKKTKTPMAIVKQDCDSFDIVPLDDAQAQGRRIFQTTHIDRFIASFSGGKDSQVVLDLCTRAIPSTDFEVIYSDTGYELPPSLVLYEEVQRYYHAKYPDLKFSTTRNHRPVLDYWDLIGTPSDSHRWCCSIMKTAPLYRSLKLPLSNKQAKVLTFDGVRAEESTKRSGYGRIGKGVKHDTVINARPILHWSSVEIFLYLWKYGLPINPAYRQGMTRVGCLICPFGNEWNEMLAREHYGEQLMPFLKRVENFSIKAGVQDVKDYVRQGGWKRRSSGNLIDRNSFIEFKSTTPNFLARLVSPQIEIDSYLFALGKYSLYSNGNERKGELRIKDNTFKISIKKVKEREFEFFIENIFDIQLAGQIKKTLLKSTYCLQCETCEVECPTGALTVYPSVSIDKDKCIHCQKCLDFHDKACIVANSLYITSGGKMTKQTNIDRYKNFGLRVEWVDNYFNEKDDFWSSAHGLNETYQIPSLKSWLKDAEIIDGNNKITELGNLLADCRENHPNLVWEIIWINLSHNSFIVNWFTNNIPESFHYSQKAMEAMIQEQFPTYREKTIHNAVYQLMRTLRESPVGSTFNQMSPNSKDTFIRCSYDDLSPEAIAYSLYKYAHSRSIYSLKVSDFYDSNIKAGVTKEFITPKSAFMRGLRTLNSNINRVIVAELNMGLDSITLRKDLTPVSCLKALV